MNNTPAEKIAAEARTAAVAYCKAHGIPTSDNSKLDMFNPAYNAAYRKIHAGLFAAMIEKLSA